MKIKNIGGLIELKAQSSEVFSASSLICENDSILIERKFLI